MNISKIKKLAEDKHISIKKIADHINMSEQNIYRCFNKNEIKAGDLEKIAQLLEVSISYFFDESTEPKQVAQSKTGHAVVNHKGNVSINDKNTNFDDCKKEVEALKKEIEYLKKINQLLENQTKKN